MHRGHQGAGRSLSGPVKPVAPVGVVKDLGQEEKGTTEDEMVDGITDSMDVSLSELRELVMDRRSEERRVGKECSG